MERRDIRRPRGTSNRMSRHGKGPTGGNGGEPESGSVFDRRAPVAGANREIRDKRMNATGKTALPAGAVLALAVFLSASTAPPRPQAPAQSAGGKLVFELDPGRSSVRWSLGSTLHTVHGTFVFTRGTVQFETGTGKASGEIVVDARSGESGNESRDRKMHAEILESGRFGQVVFRPQRIEGKLAAGGESALQVHGAFLLRGGEHEMDLPVHAEVTGKRWTGKANFRLPYLQWGLKNPSNFLLKVKPEVEIELEMAGTLENAAP
jgi:polyisoprenoid-binding protein YceI